MNRPVSEQVTAGSIGENNQSRPTESNAAQVVPEKEENPVVIDDGYQTRAIWAWIGTRGPVSRADVDDLIIRVDQAHLNVILLRAYKGNAYFEPSHSRFPEPAERLTNQSRFEDDEYQDVFEYLLSIRDERLADNNPDNDFEVHAWFAVNAGGERSSDGWPKADETEPTMLNALFPEFRVKYADYYRRNDERYYEYAISSVHQPKFRTYMTDLIAGFVEDYDVDGVHLDHIRTGTICYNDEVLDYPGTAYDYPGCQADYRAWTLATYGQEYTLWDDTKGLNEVDDDNSGRVAAWSEQAVGTLVKQIHEAVKAINPKAIISVASVKNPVTTEDRTEGIQGQVAWEWLENGWIDIAFVTAYLDDGQEVADKIKAVRAETQGSDNQARIFPGLLTYEPDDTTQFWSGEIVQQVNAAMFNAGVEQPLIPPVKGVALFVDYRFSHEAAQALGQGPFQEPARPYWGN